MDLSGDKETMKALGLSSGAFAAKKHRFRERHRDILRTYVMETLWFQADPADPDPDATLDKLVDVELQILRDAVRELGGTKQEASRD